jgi:hypothetical protein
VEKRTQQQDDDGMEGRIDGWMDGWMDGWIDRLRSGWSEGYV